MKVSIHAHHLAAPRDVTVFLEKHLLAPLRRLHDSPATELTVHVEDTKPGKGGVDQACKVTFRMPNSRTMRVEAVRDDFHAALLDCAQRLRRLVQREVQKQRSPGRAPVPRPLGRTWRQRAQSAELAPDGYPSTL
ncbi:MAG TPA: HPF/RaiA family ribosome-associated protein [Anaeromyxobacteraceae bacterium]|nr:HPF/RaiA family ribosome-associated protein [Anaeromyxobacteraceae bacterium]